MTKMTSSNSEFLISNDSIVTIDKNQVSADLEKEAVILNLKSGIYYGLDTVGAYIWNFIQEPKVVDDIVTALLTEYDVEPDRCKHDLLALLQKLAKEGLIEVTNGQNS